MTTNTLDLIAAMSDAQVEALVKASQARLQAVDVARTTALMEAAQPFLAHAIDNGKLVRRETTAWAGYEASGLEFTHDVVIVDEDGEESIETRSYTLSYNITDVKLKGSRVKGVDYHPKSA